MNIAVFVSGNGSNLQALIDAQEHGVIGSGRITLVVCDKPAAYALTRAEKHGIPVFVLEGSGFSSRDEYDKKVMKRLEEKSIELVVLAGFMRILSASFIDRYRNRILNIHPSLLPDFKGAHGIKDAYEAGVKVTGVTVHFVTEKLDSGPVIHQSRVEIDETDTLGSLEEKIHKEEHKLYPEAVRLFAEGRLLVEGDKVTVT